jgi:hypothetical protein
MEELLATVARLTETVNRIEAMMLEERKVKAENQVIAKKRAQECNTSRITLLETNRNKKIKAMEELDVNDEYYESDKQEYQEEIDNYNKKIQDLKSKQNNQK